MRNRMTLCEALQCPRGMTFEQYGNLLRKKKRLERKLGTEADRALALRDKLDILMDEEGSERYRRTAADLLVADKEIQRIHTELNKVKEALK